MNLTNEQILELGKARDILIAEIHETPIPARWETQAYKALAALEKYMSDHFIAAGLV